MKLPLTCRAEVVLRGTSVAPFLPHSLLQDKTKVVPYHGASVVEVMLIFVSVSTEVHACRHPREGPSFFQAKPTVYCYILVGDLKGWTQLP